MRTRKPLQLAMLACLLVCLTSCASAPPIVRTRTIEVKVPVIQKPPAALTAPVPDPGIDGSLVSDGWDYTLGLQCALALANAKLTAIAGDWILPANPCAVLPEPHGK